MNEAAWSIGQETSRVSQRRLFFPVTATLMMLIVFGGFSNTFYFRAITGAEGNVGFGPLPTQAIIHGVVFTLWMLIFLAQTWLVSMRRIQLHRTLGFAGIATAIGVIVVGAVTTVLYVPRSVGFGGAAMNITAIVSGNFISLLSFAVFVALAVWWRRKPVNHKRMMYFATLSILGPALAGGRRPVGALLGEFITDPGTAVISAFMIALLAYDYFHEGRLLKVSLVATGVVVAKFVVNIMFLAPNEALQRAVLSLG